MFLLELSASRPLVGSKALSTGLGLQRVKRSGQVHTCNQSVQLSILLGILLGNKPSEAALQVMLLDDFVHLRK